MWKKDLEACLRRVAELPFDSDRKLMTTFHQMDDGRYLAYTKGAPDQLLERCAGDSKEKILAANHSLAGSGRRVLAFGYRIFSELPTSRDPQTLENDLTFLGHGRNGGSSKGGSERGRSALPERPNSPDHDYRRSSCDRARHRSGTGNRSMLEIEVVTGRELKKMSQRRINRKNRKSIRFCPCIAGG